MTATTSAEHEAAELSRANATDRGPVVFAHGLRLLPSGWDRGAQLFEQAGFTAPARGRR